MNTNTDDQANVSTPFWLTYANEEAQARLNELNALRYKPFIWLPDVIREADGSAKEILETLLSSPLELHWARTLSVTVLLPIIGATFCFSGEVYLRRSFHLSSPAMWHGAIWWLLWILICLDYLFWVRIVQGNALERYSEANQSSRESVLEQRLKQAIYARLNTRALQVWYERYRANMPQLTKPLHEPPTTTSATEPSTDYDPSTKLNADELFLQLTEAIRQTDQLSADLNAAIQAIKGILQLRWNESSPAAITILDAEIDKSVAYLLDKSKQRSERNDWLAAAAATVYARLSLARARSER
jgi:hypothetical protein